MPALLIGCAMTLSLAACGGSNAEQAQAPAPAPAPGDAAGQSAGTQEPDWKAELDQVYAEAKKEGELIIFGPPDGNREELMKQFEEAYPGVKVKYTGLGARDVSSRILAEQRQGRYLTDITLKVSQGEFADLRSMIIDPDILKDENWHGGFELGFSMLEGDVYEGRYVNSILSSPTIYINNDVIPAGEITELDDLLDPKWQGQLLIKDFSLNGPGSTELAGLYLVTGQDYLDQLIASKPFISDDDRQNAQWFATGKYPIAIGLNIDQLALLNQNGVVKNVQRLRPEKAEFFSTDTIAAMKNPPHPNATKLFVNWYLSQEGQTAFVNLIENYSSRRTDVPEANGPEAVPWSKIDIENSKASISKEGVETLSMIIDLGKKYSSSLAK